MPVVEFRKECRSFAEHWVDVQREEFKRLGVEGDWANPYPTMAYPAEAQIAREIMKFAETGQLYRGSKPVMWSVVEKTALAEAEVEYEEHTSDTIYVAFPVSDVLGLRSGAVDATMDGSLSRHLDDDPLDDPRQPRDRRSQPQDRLRPLPGHRGARRQLGQSRRDTTSSQTNAGRRACSRPPRSRASSA